MKCNGVNVVKNSSSLTRRTSNATSVERAVVAVWTVANSGYTLASVRFFVSTIIARWTVVTLGTLRRAFYISKSAFGTFVQSVIHFRSIETEGETKRQRDEQCSDGVH